MCKPINNNSEEIIRESYAKKDFIVNGEFSCSACFFAVLANRKETDSGRIGDASEITIRLWRARSLSAVIECVRTAGRDDLQTYVFEDGKKTAKRVEIKTACGRLDNARKSPYMAYCPEVDLNDLENLPEQFFMFPMQDFWDCLDNWDNVRKEYHGRGNSKILRWDSQRGTLHIQSFRATTRPKASLPIREYLQDICAERMTMGEYFAQYED